MTLFNGTDRAGSKFEVLNSILRRYFADRIARNVLYDQPNARAYACTSIDVSPNGTESLFFLRNRRHAVVYRHHRHPLRYNAALIMVLRDLVFQLCIARTYAYPRLPKDR